MALPTFNPISQGGRMVGMMLRGAGIALLLGSAAVGAITAPAAATSCETGKIQARSIDETAKVIFESSDYLGFAFVRQLPGAPALQQQEVDIFAPLKGEPAIVRLSPRLLNGVGREDGMMRWLDAKPGDISLVALVRTQGGAAMPVCLAEAINAKPAPELYRALVRLGRSGAR